MGILDTLSGAMYGDRNANMTELLSDISLSNRFGIRLSSPNGNTTLFDIEKDSFRCKGVSIPSVTIETTDLNYYGINRKVATGKTFDTINLELIDADGGKLREKFHEWQSIIFNKATGKLGFYSDYIATNLEVYVMSFKNVKSYTKIVFTEVYPILISDIKYDRSSTNQLVEFQVSFAYRHFYYADLADTSSKNDLNIFSKITETAENVVSSVKQGIGNIF
jgi:hypothetical protein